MFTFTSRATAWTADVHSAAENKTAGKTCRRLYTEIFFQCFADMLKMSADIFFGDMQGLGELPCGPAALG